MASICNNPEASLPIVDMLNMFVWYLWCDQQSTTATPLNHNYLKSFLSMGKPEITPLTYLGALIMGRFCPNFAFHFHIDGWPMDLSNAHLSNAQALGFQGFLICLKYPGKDDSTSVLP
jgi:hypothetical protein